LTIVSKKNFNVEYLRIQVEIQRAIPRLNRNPITQVIEFRITVLGTDSENHWKFGKTKHENVLKI